MSANRVGAGGLPATAGGGSSGPPLSSEAILDLCDGLLGEIGRRMHRFSWLRDPSAPIVSYLPLDSYYPGNRLVVVMAPKTVEQESLCREQVPAHGFHLLWLAPDDLGGDPRTAADRLLDCIHALGPLPERPVERVYRNEPQRSVWTPAPQTSPPPPPPAPATEPRPPERRRDPAPPPQTASAASSYTRSHSPRHGSRESQERAGIFLGLALAVILGAETFGLVIAFALQGGHIALALGLAFDVCARGLGTVAAVREGSDDVAWGCMIFGSPAVISFAYLNDEPVATEPAPLAGALGALSCALIVIWIFGRILGL